MAHLFDRSKLSIRWVNYDHGVSESISTLIHGSFMFSVSKHCWSLYEVLRNKRWYPCLGACSYKYLMSVLREPLRKHASKQCSNWRMWEYAFFILSHYSILLSWTIADPFYSLEWINVQIVVCFTINNLLSPICCISLHSI